MLKGKLGTLAHIIFFQNPSTLEGKTPIPFVGKKQGKEKIYTFSVYLYPISSSTNT